MTIAGVKNAGPHAQAHREIRIPRLVMEFLGEEEAQGLVEYVLILALIAFAAVAGMSSLATAINSAFAKVGTYLGKYIS